MSKLLPADFSDLNRFTEKWILPSEAARHHTRLNSTFEELKDLYDTMLPRMDAIIMHLDKFKLGEMPEKESNLMELAFSFMEVTTAVELFKRASVVSTRPGSRSGCNRRHNNLHTHPAHWLTGCAVL